MKSQRLTGFVLGDIFRKEFLNSFKDLNNVLIVFDKFSKVLKVLKLKSFKTS